MANTIETRKKAFEKVIGIKGIWHYLEGETQAAVLNMRTNHKKGKVSEDRMKQILELYGAEVVQEEVWELP